MTIKEVMNDVCQSAENIMLRGKCDVILDAYNTYEENNRDGVDYIFSLENKNHLAECVRGGMELEDGVGMQFNVALGLALPYFLFGVNYGRPRQIKDKEELRTLIMGEMEDIVADAMQCPWAYKEFYEKFIAPIIFFNKR